MLPEIQLAEVRATELEAELKRQRLSQAKWIHPWIISRISRVFLGFFRWVLNGRIWLMTLMLLYGFWGFDSCFHSDISICSGFNVIICALFKRPGRISFQLGCLLLFPRCAKKKRYGQCWPFYYATYRHILWEMSILIFCPPLVTNCTYCTRDYGKGWWRLVTVGGKPQCSQDDTRALADHRRGRQRCWFREC